MRSLKYMIAIMVVVGVGCVSKIEKMEFPMNKESVPEIEFVSAGETMSRKVKEAEDERIRLEELRLEEIRLEELRLEEIRLEELRLEEIRLEEEALQTKKDVIKAGTLFTMSVEATAYSDDPITAIGSPTVPWHTVASDWDVIPRGSRFWIDDFGPETIFTVEDVGGAVKGHIIDIYHPSVEWAWDWGRRQVNINIIRWGED